MKQYIITDPCYLIKENWGEICFDNNKIAEELTKLTNEKAYVHETLYGDWSNYITGTNILHSDFCADSGLVCICLFNEKIKSLTENLPLFCYGVFETKELKSVNFDTSLGDWLIVEIQAAEGVIRTSEE